MTFGTPCIFIDVHNSLSLTFLHFIFFRHCYSVKVQGTQRQSTKRAMSLPANRESNPSNTISYPGLKVSLCVLRVSKVMVSTKWLQYRPFSIAGIVDSSNTDLNPLPIQALLRSVFDESTIAEVEASVSQHLSTPKCKGKCCFYFNTRHILFWILSSKILTSVAKFLNINLKKKKKGCMVSFLFLSSYEWIILEP